MTRNLRRLLLFALLVPAACGSQAATPGPGTVAATPAPTDTPAATADPTTSASTPSPSAGTAVPSNTVWLCLPGRPKDPCAGDLSTTVIDPSGRRTTQTLEPAADPKIDCFYVYPTVSRQKTINATLTVDPEERAAAVAQAALFSQVCRVYAPIYPQLTSAALGSGKITFQNVMTAYNGVKDAWADYLANYNHGRGVVLIGHSQGAMLLAGLIRLEIDDNAVVRKRIVSALLMGGNVTVAQGQVASGDFANIPACQVSTQVGCVVGYSSFATTPPKNAAFGRVANAIGMLQLSKSESQQILCVNPAALGGKGALLPYFPTAELSKRAGAPRPTPKTTYVSYPSELSAECKSDGDASWLQVSRIGPKGGTPQISGSEGPGWGLHDLDVSLALGNLVELVGLEAAAYAG